MDSIKRMGILYGKLGLSTDASLIERRGRGVEAAADALQKENVPEIVRYVFGLPHTNSDTSFLEEFRSLDPTFDVQLGDREAALLASSVVACEMEKDTSISGLLALCLVTGSLGGIRSPLVDDQLLKLADKALVYAQGEANLVPPNREYTAQPTTLIDAVKTLRNGGFNHASHITPHVAMSLEELGKYSEANALAAANSDNQILHYIRQLEEELRTQWWVTGGWSTEAGLPFRALSAIEAALRAGKELADKNSTQLGLFAAPALLSMVVETGRKNVIREIALSEIATPSSLAWRLEYFGATAENPLADLLPVTTALGLAALSSDDDDWQPCFRRLTKIDLKKKLHPLDIGLQVYRERVLLRALEAE